VRARRGRRCGWTICAIVVRTATLLLPDAFQGRPVRRCGGSPRSSTATARDPEATSGEAPAAVAPVDPFLWVIAAGTPTTLLTKLLMVPAAEWPTGVYWFGEDVLRVGLVAARELPRDRTTLLVRLMAAGPLLASAVPEVARLARDAPERAVAEPIL
jgi:hypothetical protein